MSEFCLKWEVICYLMNVLNNPNVIDFYTYCVCI